MSSAQPEIKSAPETQGLESWALRTRRLLARLRDVMAGDRPASEKLHEIVSVVAMELRADVCSCYVLRGGETLELFADVGLDPERIESARWEIGQGVVGDVAMHGTPLSLADITTSPSYIRRAETGEDGFRAFCGVPILRGSRIRGVLVVRNRARRVYGDEIVELLQTVAMLVAEIVVSGELISRKELRAYRATARRPAQLEGEALSPGIGIGQVVFHEPVTGVNRIVADDPVAEKGRLSKALQAMQSSIKRLIACAESDGNMESKDVLESYQLFARDNGWLNKIAEKVNQGLSAEAAVQRVQNETRLRMLQISDAYIRERLADFEDVSNRLMSHLVGNGQPAGGLPDEVVLVAPSLGPAVLLDFAPGQLRGLVLETGSRSNHVAIVARALGIPVVGQCSDAHSWLLSGDRVIVDGDSGVVHVRPSQSTVDLYRNKRESALAPTVEDGWRDLSPVTRDGCEIGMHINAGLLSEAAALDGANADGIGLFRTELAFMNWKKYPSVAYQAVFYGKVMDRADGKPVVFRTLDIGGDKPLPYFNPAGEENPALGWRAIRIGLDRPAVLRTQFRALIRGAEGRELRVMLPLVSEVAEIDAARALFDREVAQARENGQPVPKKTLFGVMIEVPSILWQLDEVLADIDFVSVGTNDLLQYVFAADRGNATTRDRYDILSPAMLRIMKTLVEKCDAAGVPLNVCGEAASSPLEAMALLALGVRSLSMPGHAMPPVRAMIASLDAGETKTYIESQLSSRAHSLRDQLRAYASDHGVVLKR